MVGVKLKASSLVEVLTAMTIIGVVMGIAMMIFVSVLESDQLYQKHLANHLLNELALQTKNSQLFVDDRIETEYFLVEKNIQSYQGNSELILLHLSAYDKAEKLVLERKELVYLESGK